VASPIVLAGRRVTAGRVLGVVGRRGRVAEREYLRGLDDGAARLVQETAIGVDGLRGRQLASRLREAPASHHVDPLEPFLPRPRLRDADHEAALTVADDRGGGDDADEEDSVELHRISGG
jgi:hypothetical protein